MHGVTKARAYRHAFWDAGTSLANSLGVCASLDLAANLVLGFADADVNALLGVDGEREATLALCAVGRTDQTPPPVRDVRPVAHATEPLSSSEVTFADIPRMRAASELGSGAEAAACRDGVARKFYLYPTTNNTGRYWYGLGFFDFGFTSAVADAAKFTGTWAAAGPITPIGM